MNKPVKLIRELKAARLVKEGKILDEELDYATSDQLQDLMYLKIREELEEVKNSRYRDINEFADLCQAVTDFLNTCNISQQDLEPVLMKRLHEDGRFKRLILTNLNPNNPSNKIYFDTLNNQ